MTDKQRAIEAVQVLGKAIVRMVKLGAIAGFLVIACAMVLLGAYVLISNIGVDWR